VKRKRPPASADSDSGRSENPPEIISIPESLIQEAKRAFDESQKPKAARCTVCGEACAPNSTEGLCWICRRLKLSAWRDSDTQMPAQE